MESFSELIQQGAGQAWWFLPTAVVLGALHGLEPGHSKTMMAAFIIAVRGTVSQAILLGLSAAFSHVVIVWVLAIAALTLGDEYIAETSEPYLFFASGVIIVLMALWMGWRTLVDLKAARESTNHRHHADGNDHCKTPHTPHHDHGEGYGKEKKGHSHGHLKASDFATEEEYQDAHERAHTREIQERFTNRRVTTGQIVLFGLTGGLLPCTASVTVLLVCLQLDEIVLGIAMVAAFSLGLAIAMVGVGVAAAWGSGQATARFKNFDQIARKLPLLSSVVIAIVGVIMSISGWMHLP
ncbi:MAG: nickel/cobalt efflux transporter RcnA [Magnetococcales bacterium]|nr:nickel/cobalt efflux transporter RcnA [Magnetococcales bacterium]